jgi:hypothetical protein
MIVIGLLNTGGYGFGWGWTKKEAIDHILTKIEHDGLDCLLNVLWCILV